MAEKNTSETPFSAAQGVSVKATERREELNEVIKKVDELFPSSGNDAGANNNDGTGNGNGGG